ncbi:AAA family ATPase [Actinosynnema sp. NPDC020468]|uniref:helix-turn-helix transcriptional regulator n=1 Tax=Actinosynnema sp. NPDC020468 TaxID=3154488 RepID=UPI0033EFE1D6
MAGAGARPEPPVGRGPQLDRIEKTLTEVSSGAFRVVAIRGEPGVGKTALLTALVANAGAHGLPVLSGRATEFEQDVPFGLFVDAFDRLPASGSEPLAEPLAVLKAAAIGRSAELDRYRLFRGVRALLTARPGVVLALDDLHWADPSSLQLIEYLLRRPPTGSALIAVAHRTSQPPPGLSDALAHLGSSAVRLALEPLTPADVARLFAHVPARRRALLHRATRGNPLYLRALADADDQTLTALVEHPVDENAEPERALLDVLSTELQALDPVTRRVAQAAAVAGDPAGPDLVAAVADLPPTAAASAFDELSRIGLVVAEGPRFRFRHPLIRAAAYWIAPPAWRTAAHRRAAAHLRDRRGSLLLLAHHTERSARPGDETAVDTLAQAAAVSRHASPATAARLVRRALQLLPDEPAFTDRRSELRMLLARALGLSGELAESRRLLHEVIGADGPHRAEAVTFSAVIYRLLGRLDEAKAMLTTELARLPAVGGPTAQALIELAGVELLRHDVEGACDHASRAVEAAAGTGNTAMGVAAHALMAIGSLHAGATRAARTHVDRASVLMDTTTDTLLLTELTTVAPLAWVELHLGDHVRAARHLARALGLATRSGLTHSIPYLLVVDSTLWARHGDPERAIASAEDAREYARIMNAPETAALADVILLRPTLWRHGPRHALRLADRLDDAVRPTTGWWAELARLNLAEVYLAAGRYDSCLAEVAGGRPDPHRSALAAVALARLGRHPEAAATAAVAVDLAERTGLPYLLGVAHCARARVLVCADRPEEAAPDAEAAVAHFAAAGSPVEEGHARHVLAVLLAALGRTDQAHGELARAKSLYTTASVTWQAAELARDAARLHRAPRPGLGVLTAREREIVDLATAGLTNREIAERLYLSPKTVETHLYRAYTKLDVRSRVDLTRRVGRDG